MTADDAMRGVVYEIAAREEWLLDAAEGAGYDKTHGELEGPNGIIRASIYVANQWRAGERPYRWYTAYVVAGAKEHELPAEYVQARETVPAKIDRDQKRSAREARTLAEGLPGEIKR